ncbi:MAG: NUDIX hydrolase [Candidatus Moranbacteria bacterium]|nr:NUDIX hydrolase [Candidatus Moranbacteria bacterium]
MRAKTGVGFILSSVVDKETKFLVIEELRDNEEIFKKSGMISFPLETMEEGESPKETIFRLLEEELGIASHEVEISEIPGQKFRFFPGKNIVTRYGYGFLLGDPYRAFTPKDTDIRIRGWMSIEELRGYGNVRVETLPILNHFVASYRARYIEGRLREVFFV